MKRSALGQRLLALVVGRHACRLPWSPRCSSRTPWLKRTLRDGCRCARARAPRGQRPVRRPSPAERIELVGARRRRPARTNRRRAPAAGGSSTSARRGGAASSGSARPAAPPPARLRASAARERVRDAGQRRERDAQRAQVARLGAAALPAGRARSRSRTARERSRRPPRRRRVASPATASSRARIASDRGQRRGSHAPAAARPAASPCGRATPVACPRARQLVLAQRTARGGARRRVDQHIPPRRAPRPVEARRSPLLGELEIAQRGAGRAAPARVPSRRRRARRAWHTGARLAAALGAEASTPPSASGGTAPAGLAAAPSSSASRRAAGTRSAAESARVRPPRARRGRRPGGGSAPDVDARRGRPRRSSRQSSREPVACAAVEQAVLGERARR